LALDPAHCQRPWFQLLLELLFALDCLELNGGVRFWLLQ
jgi:hypothetical protein